MLDADTLARRVAALQAEQPGSAVAAATPLSVDDPDAVLLAAHRLSAQHRSGPHPLEPTLAGPAPGLELDPAPAGKARRTTA